MGLIGNFSENILTFEEYCLFIDCDKLMQFCFSIIRNVSDSNNRAVDFSKQYFFNNQQKY